MSSLALRLYAAATTLAQPLLRRKLARRSLQEPGYGAAIEERFGRYAQAPEAASELVWVHAVSLGETRAAAILLEALRAQYPDLRVLLTHGTATGRAEGAALLKPGDVQVWQPWDSPAAVARFFDHFRPRLGLLMETEVWPCMLAAAQKRGLPVVLVNARLSEKSLAQAQRLSRLSGPAYAGLSAIYAQTADDARRYGQLGAASTVFGNLKYDATPSALQLEQGRSWRAGLSQAVLMFASSREGEESGFFKQISAGAQSEYARVAPESIATTRQSTTPSGPHRYLVVPRHPQRFDEVEALAVQQGLKVSRRSSWPAGGPAQSDDALRADVWLGDSLGEMALYYALADVALLGGSFESLGGQNLIEAAACGCPVVMGPHTFNFAEAANLSVSAGAAVRVADLPAAFDAAERLAGDAAALQAAVDAGLAFAGQNRGATSRTLDALQPYLG